MAAMSARSRDASGEDASAHSGVASIPADWLADFEAASRRDLPTRFRYSFIHTCKPVLDDAKFRSFDTMREYREWCEREPPSWLGYGRV